MGEEATGTEDESIERSAHDLAWNPSELPSWWAVRAVARVTDRDPLELAPLANTIDPDALDALFDSGDETTVVTFRYEGFEIRIGGGGDLHLAAG